MNVQSVHEKSKNLLPCSWELANNHDSPNFYFIFIVIIFFILKKSSSNDGNTLNDVFQEQLT